MRIEDSEILSARFESAVRKAFIQVYGRPHDLTVIWRSILSSYLPKGRRLEWVKPGTLTILILTELGWIRDPFLSRVDFSRWQKVSAILSQAGWGNPGWDSINPAVHVVFAESAPARNPSLGDSEPNEYAVARITLDDRSFGPAYCGVCDADADVDELFLMSDGKLVCVDCETPVPEYADVSHHFQSARAATEEERKKYRRHSRSAGDF